MKVSGSNIGICFLTTVSILICLLSAVESVEYRTGTVEVVTGSRVSNVSVSLSAASRIKCSVACMEFDNTGHTCATASYNHVTHVCELSEEDAGMMTYENDTNISGLILTRDEVKTQFGKSFIVGFMTNGLSNGGIPYLYISTRDATNVRVQIPYISIDETVAVDGSLELVYSTQLTMDNDTQKAAKAIEITADDPVSLYSVNAVSGSSGGSVMLPESMLGTEYILDTHGSGVTGSAEVIITGTTQNTLVTIQFPSGENETVTLDRFDVFQRQSLQLIGAIVSASNVVNVQVGHGCANIPNESDTYCDMITTSLPPISALNKNVVVPYMKPRANFSVGIVVPYDDTFVEVFDPSGLLLTSFYLDKHNWSFLSYSHMAVSVRSTKAVMVTQYGHGGAGILGDPSLSVVPSPEHYTNFYSFFIPAWYLSPSVVCIVIHSTADVSGLRLNYSNFTSTESFDVSIPGVGNYSVIYTDVTNGHNTLYHVDASIKFGAFMYARTQFEEYATVLGYEI